ncbi:MAG TPA: hypothetical protein VHF06_36285 [Pseudonocardiaceae bacterium]|nr:hypothetical protein [Pseudonocardiaceae bacterium]
MKRALVLAAVGAGLLAAVPATASADTGPVVLTVAYDVSGTSTVAKTNSTIDLGPATLTTGLDAQGNFTGTLPLPPTTTSFKALGLLPTTATVSFVPAGPVTGALSAHPNVMITSTATYYLRLSDVTVAGLPALVGDHCQTKDPVTIPANTPDGQTFNITTGGTVTGTYTIGAFDHCGLTTPLINLLVPGSGNTVTLQLSNGRVVTS